MPDHFLISKRDYYADFIVTPTAALLAAVWLFMTIHVSISLFASSVIVGFGFWTFIEYAIHRWGFHGFLFEGNHREHHIRPPEYIGVSSKITPLVFVVLWFLLPWIFLPVIGTGLFVGLLTGYFAYIVLHDWFHHHYSRGAIGWIDYLYLNHEFHHRRFRVNFGVTSPFWDFIFGTYTKPLTK